MYNSILGQWEKFSDKEKWRPWIRRNYRGPSGDMIKTYIPGHMEIQEYQRERENSTTFSGKENIVYKKHAYLALKHFNICVQERSCF